MEKLLGMLKFFLLWLLFLVMLPFGLVAVGVILLGTVIVMPIKEEKRDRVHEWLFCMLYNIISAICHYGDLMESCVNK